MSCCVGQHAVEQRARPCRDLPNERSWHAGGPVGQLPGAVGQAEQRLQRNRDRHYRPTAPRAFPLSAEQLVCEQIGAALVHRPGVVGAECASQRRQARVDRGKVGSVEQRPRRPHPVVLDPGLHPSVRQGPSVPAFCLIRLGTGHEARTPRPQLGSRPGHRELPRLLVQLLEAAGTNEADSGVREDGGSIAVQLPRSPAGEDGGK